MIAHKQVHACPWLERQECVHITTKLVTICASWGLCLAAVILTVSTSGDEYWDTTSDSVTWGQSSALMVMTPLGSHFMTRSRSRGIGDQCEVLVSTLRSVLGFGVDVFDHHKSNQHAHRQPDCIASVNFRFERGVDLEYHFSKMGYIQNF